MIGAVKTQYLKTWRDFTRDYRGLFRKIKTGDLLGQDDASLLSVAIGRMLWWADIGSAAGIRWRANHTQIIVPEPSDPTPQKVLAANDWLVPHMLETDALAQQRALWIGQVETRYLNQRRDFIKKMDQGKSAIVPIYRAERIRRDSVGEIAALSQQVELSIPEIGDAFPYAEYRSREDRRVRPTHAAMDGFVALRSWRHWDIVHPPCAWNCRCVTRFYAIHECKDKGWLTLAGKPRFELRWPNSAAKRNFETGLFPEWKKPRMWSTVGSPALVA